MSRQTALKPRLASKWRKLAESRCHQNGERLTPARLSAYAEIIQADRPVTAYELLALMEKRQEKKLAPLTVYRHLDFLTRNGLVHRLESTQSYVQCVHPEHAHESQYLLCSSCGQADEVESKTLETLLMQLATERGFRPENTVVEMKGICDACATG